MAGSKVGVWLAEKECDASTVRTACRLWRRRTLFAVRNAPQTGGGGGGGGGGGTSFKTDRDRDRDRDMDVAGDVAVAVLELEYATTLLPRLEECAARDSFSAPLRATLLEVIASIKVVVRSAPFEDLSDADAAAVSFVEKLVGGVLSPASLVSAAPLGAIYTRSARHAECALHGVCSAGMRSTRF